MQSEWVDYWHLCCLGIRMKNGKKYFSFERSHMWHKCQKLILKIKTVKFFEFKIQSVMISSLQEWCIVVSPVILKTVVWFVLLRVLKKGISFFYCSHSNCNSYVVISNRNVSHTAMGMKARVDSVFLRKCCFPCLYTVLPIIMLKTKSIKCMIISVLGCT